MEHACELTKLEPQNNQDAPKLVPRPPRKAHEDSAILCSAHADALGSRGLEESEQRCVFVGREGLKVKLQLSWFVATGWCSVLGKSRVVSVCCVENLARVGTSIVQYQILNADSYAQIEAMALVISPAARSLPTAPPSPPCPSLRSRRYTRQSYYCCPAARCQRRHRSTDLQIKGVNNGSPVGLERNSSRRRFLALLLSGGATRPLAQSIIGRYNEAAAASVADVKIESSSEELQDEKTIEGPNIGDLFGFDGLGKTPEEYVLGKVVALAQAGDGAVLFLGVDGFELPLQLVVGPAEAMAVLTAVQERKSRRPLTHEAWGLSLAAVGWKVDRVVITANEKDVFYSSVVLSNLSQLLSNSATVKKSVDMRPSDGIALALRCRAPLFVRRKVAEDLLSRKDELAGKTQVDPLNQPGLQANAGTIPVFVESLVASGIECKPDCTVHSSWMRRLSKCLRIPSEEIACRVLRSL